MASSNFVWSYASAIVSSSSGYSISTSICASVSIKDFWTRSISWLKFPAKRPAAFWLEALVRLSMISRTASAFVRSVLPFIKARKVNSPRSACLKPFCKSKLKIFVTTAVPPWQEISAISSPVKDFGARKTDTKTSSTRAAFWSGTQSRAAAFWPCDSFSSAAFWSCEQSWPPPTLSVAPAFCGSTIQP